MAHVIQPTRKHDRIDLLDMLRGFALLGILLVNMAIFSFSFLALFTGTPRGEGVVDRVSEFLILALATGKFYPLFSFLFGLGMWMQIERVEAAGGRPGRFMVRRLIILLGLGLMHALLIWNGDILFVYALVGLVALLFRRLQSRTLLIWVAVLFGLPIVLGLGFTALGLLLGGSTAGASGETDQFMAMISDLEQRAIAIYGSGSWGEIFVWRALEWIAATVFYFFSGNVLQILAFFLIGMYVGKRRLVQHLYEQPAVQRRLPFGGMCLAIGLVANLALAWLVIYGNLDSILVGLLQQLLPIVAPILTYGYVAMIIGLTRSDTWRRWLQPLAAAGRMALSNYIGQSIICTFIFYSYGLGLFGQVVAFNGLLLSLVIWIVQLGLSVVWLRFFQYGPLEWVWRSLTYGVPQRMTPQPQQSSVG